jgi:Ca2+-binding EF-hand superfamily protein
MQFAGMTKLKKAAFLVMARCLSSEEISGLRQLFKTIDTDSNGTITVDELKVSHLSQIASACQALHIAMVSNSRPASMQVPA